MPATNREPRLRSSSKASLRHAILQLRGQRDLSVSDCLTPPLLPRSGTRRARCSGWPTGETTSMRTTGVPQVRPTSAGSQRCLRSCMRAVVRRCCCTHCCTELTLTRQASSAGVSPTSLSQVVLVSSSRSQVQTRTASAAASLACDRSSVGVRWRPPLSVAIVTHFVTRPFASR